MTKEQEIIAGIRETAAWLFRTGYQQDGTLLFAGIALIEELQKDKERGEWMRRFLKQIKHHCLTSKDSTPMILSAIVRMCIDAGITQSYLEIEAEWRDDAATQPNKPEL